MAVPKTLADMAALREGLASSVAELSLTARPCDAPMLVETARTLESVTAAESKLAADLAEAKRLAAVALKRADEVAKTPLPGASFSVLAAPPMTAASRKELDSLVAREAGARSSAKSLLATELTHLTHADAKSALASARESVRCMEAARRITASAVLLERVKQLDKVDLAFLVDATGSMGTYIEQVKEQVSTIVSDMQRNEPELKMRLAFVG